MANHAILSASGAERWLNCTPSARLEEQLPESTSGYAEEGHLAHSLAELMLRKKFQILKPSEFKKALKAIEDDPIYQPEMKEHVNTYVDYISGIIHSYNSPPYIGIERKLDFSHIVPDGFGTGDCIIIGGTVLHIIDFKYGQGVPVSAIENPQMKLYALGALTEYSILYEISEITMSIVQPRLNSISEFNLTREELEAWGEKIKPIAEAAFAGVGEYASGEWCKFCRAKATCRARSENMTALEAFGMDKPPLLSDIEVGDILQRAQTLKAWVTDLEEYALSSILAGTEIPGWKAVEGRSNRQFTDTDQAFAVVKQAGYDEAMLYQRKPITLTEVEKLLGKKSFIDLLNPYVIKPQGKPTLAVESDPREPFKNQTSAAEAFATEN